MNRKILAGVAAAAVLVLIGAIAFGLIQRPAAQPRATAADPNYLLSEPPGGAMDVTAVRESAHDNQEITVVGRIGGRENPWIRDSAAFSIVDRSRTPCSELPGDTCETPWDYCCESDLSAATLLVMVHDADDKLVRTDARTMLGVKELDTVVVQGRARRDTDGNVSIVAAKVFVAPEKNE